MEYHVQVNTYGDRDGVYTGNAVKHPDLDTATEAAKDLFFRWTAVKYWRVIDDNQQVIASNAEDG